MTLKIELLSGNSVQHTFKFITYENVFYKASQRGYIKVSPVSSHQIGFDYEQLL